VASCNVNQTFQIRLNTSHNQNWVGCWTERAFRLIFSNKFSEIPKNNSEMHKTFSENQYISSIRPLDRSFFCRDLYNFGWGTVFEFSGKLLDLPSTSRILSNIPLPLPRNPKDISSICE
jgi:hypothetical protein